MVVESWGAHGDEGDGALGDVKAGILLVPAYRRFEGSIGGAEDSDSRGLERLKKKRKRNLKVGDRLAKLSGKRGVPPGCWQLDCVSGSLLWCGRAEPLWVAKARMERLQNSEEPIYLFSVT